MRFLILVALLTSAEPVSAQIASIQRISYGYPLIDSLPTNQFPRGGAYTAIIQGSGLKNATGFTASNSNVTGVVSSVADNAVTVQLSSTAVQENDTADAPIPDVSFALQTLSGSINSGPVTIDIVVGPPTQITSFMVSNSIKWIPGGVATTVTYAVTALWAGNNQFWYAGCGPCIVTFGVFTGDRFSVSFFFTTVVTTPRDTNVTLPVLVGAVDGAGQGGILGSAPLSPKTLTLPIVQTQLVDPVPDLLDGPNVSSDVMVLGNQALGRVVQAISADGVSTLVIRLIGAPPNEDFSLSLSADGGLADAGSSNFGSSLTLQADSSGSAVLLYRAPIDFARAGGMDGGSTSRVADILFQSPDNNPAVVGDAPIMILRPPVVLVHGLWDSSQAWSGFAPLVGDSRFFLRTVDYNGLVSGITASSPAFTSLRLARARQSSLGFAYNAPNVLGQIRQFISEFKTTNQAAAIQADVVAHSMGGDISRSLRRLPDYASSDTFSQGPLHKLITIGTPHLGTPLATKLVQATNSCVRNLLALAGNIAFTEVAFSSATYSGGVGDLQGDGFGGALSLALQGVQSATVHAAPTASIAGTMTTANLAGLNCPLGMECAAEVIRDYCSPDPLATALTPTGWPGVFGQSSDAIVPRFSQLDGSYGIEFTGLVHSVGAETLSFAGPTELDQASGIPARVIDLLNEPTAGPDFRIF